MGGEHKEPTKEQRIVMAGMHEKMAVCLRSERPMEECHKEMMDACKANKDSCPFHGGGHHHGDKSVHRDDDEQGEDQGNGHHHHDAAEDDTKDGRDK